MSIGSARVDCTAVGLYEMEHLRLDALFCRCHSCSGSLCHAAGMHSEICLNCLVIWSLAVMGPYSFVYTRGHSSSSVRASLMGTMHLMVT